MSNLKSINPKTLFNSAQYGFSQIVVSPPGKMVFISGQVAWDENQQLIGENNLALQTQKSIDNLSTAMKAVGGSLQNIVLLRLYIVNYKQGDGPIISQALINNFGTENQPTSTWISVQGLVNEGFMIEIEAQAIL